MRGGVLWSRTLEVTTRRDLTPTVGVSNNSTQFKSGNYLSPLNHAVIFDVSVGEIYVRL